MVTIQDYKELLEDRPEKFDEDNVAYREAEGKEKCSRCLHFYERKIDQFGVCEIMRSDETDEKGVDPEYCCDFYTINGTSFPLRPRAR